MLFTITCIEYMYPAVQGIINFHNGKPYDLIDKAEGTNYINFTNAIDKPKYENHILVRMERESISNQSVIKLRIFFIS
jgi:hypothetical protein